VSGLQKVIKSVNTKNCLFTLFHIHDHAAFAKHPPATMQGTMKALWYDAVSIEVPSIQRPLKAAQPKTFKIKEVPIPQITDDEVLLKGISKLFL